MDFGDMPGDERFLQETWIPPKNGCRLRHHLMLQLLALMVDKAKKTGQDRSLQGALRAAERVKLESQQVLATCRPYIRCGEAMTAGEILIFEGGAQ